MGMFVLVTIISLILLVTVVVYIGTGTPVTKYVPIKQTVDVEKVDWDVVDSLSGIGLVIDAEGRVLQQFNDVDGPERLSVEDITNLMRLRGNERTTAIYDTTDGQKLLLMYPSNILESTLSLNLNEVMGEEDYKILWMLGGVLFIYLILVYLIIRRLSKNIQREVDKLRDEEEQKKDLFFRGLAHDVKTPLAAIVAYSSAIQDGVVPEAEQGKYVEGIHRNANLLKDRVNEMMDLTTLNNQGIYQPEKGDLLEHIRRYVGQNYTWYLERDSLIELNFDADQKYETTFDRKLFSRVLQNILENSVKHNDRGVNITIDFDEKSETLKISDDGKGISKELHTKIFEPMVTGDESRTGEHLRGMGLANVKRIVKLHGWHIYYDDAFYLKIK